MPSVLIIDDDPLNVQVIQARLQGAGYTVKSARDGEVGWKMVKANCKEFAVILLDRNMPNMDGIEFMQKIKNDDSCVSLIPVIMQTAASEPEEIEEGVKAGVYYYLTKPFEKQVLLSIVDAAIRDTKEQTELTEQLQQHKSLLSYIDRSDLTIRTLEDAQTLAPILATFFPSPEKVLLGISELLVNAVEHGNAGITYDEKTELNNAGTWEQEVNRRIELEDNRHKQVRVSFDKQKDAIYLTITDQGEGFEWEQYMHIDPLRATNNHGRGIAMSNLMSFDSLEYRGRGNSVVCSVKYEQAGIKKFA